MANIVMTQGGEVSVKDLLNEYFGFGGAAGGGTLSAGGLAAGGLAALGTTLIGKIVNSGKALPKGEATNGATATPTTENNQKLDITKGNKIVENPLTQTLGNLGQGIKEAFGNLGQGLKNILTNEKTTNPPINQENRDEEKSDTETNKSTELGKPLNPPLYQENRDGEEQEPVMTPGIPDNTNENTETPIEPTFDMQTMFDFIKQQQREQWDREDAIRAETQAREDNAWQRAVEDMRQAGVNPNLVNAGPAESGGGITQATGLDYTPFTVEAEKELTLLEQAIEQGFQGDQKEKDRIIELIGNVLKIFSIMSITSKTTITKTP